MAGVLTTTITNHLKKVDPHVVVDAVERRSELFNLFQKRFATGGTGPTWKARYGKNTSVGSYGEGDTDPAAGNQTYESPTLVWKYNKGVVRVERIAIDQANSHYEIGVLVQDEIQGAARDMGDEIDEQLASDGTGNSSKDITGIQIANDAAGTYAGLARGSFTWWASVEQAAIGTLALTDLQVPFATLRNATRRSKPDIILSNATVFDIAANLMDDRLTHNLPVGTVLPNGVVLQHGVASLQYRGAMWLEIPSYTAQRFDILQLSDWHIDIVRNFQWDPVEIDDDAITTKMTVGMQLVCDHPGRQAHGIGITA